MKTLEKNTFEAHKWIIKRCKTTAYHTRLDINQRWSSLPSSLRICFASVTSLLPSFKLFYIRAVCLFSSLLGQFFQTAAHHFWRELLWVPLQFEVHDLVRAMLMLIDVLTLTSKCCVFSFFFYSMAQCLEFRCLKFLPTHSVLTFKLSFFLYACIHGLMWTLQSVSNRYFTL